MTHVRQSGTPSLILMDMKSHALHKIFFKVLNLVKKLNMMNLLLLKLKQMEFLFNVI